VVIAVAAACLYIIDRLWNWYMCVR